MVASRCIRATATPATVSARRRFHNWRRRRVSNPHDRLGPLRAVDRAADSPWAAPGIGARRRSGPASTQQPPREGRRTSEGGSTTGSGPPPWFLATFPALHYHYAGKSELGQPLIGRYAIGFTEALAASEIQTPDAWLRLDHYADLHLDMLRDQRMCPCGMMAGEYETLPALMQEAVIRFFHDTETWLTRVLGGGRESGTLEFVGSPHKVAQTVVVVLQGAMLVARPRGDISRFQAAVDRLLASLRNGPSRSLEDNRTKRPNE